MCDKEFKETISFQNFRWNSRFKWFTPNLDYQERVRDGSFNNSKFEGGRYEHLVKIEIRDSDAKFFSKIGKRELMLDRRKANNVIIKSIEVL